MTPSEMSLSELWKAVMAGVLQVKPIGILGRGYADYDTYESIAQEYARRTENCVSVEDVVKVITEWPCRDAMVARIQSLNGAKP